MSLSRVVVPRGGIPTLCTFRNGNLVELQNVPITQQAEIITSVDGWSAWYHEENLTPVYCTRDWSEQSLAEMRQFAPPRFEECGSFLAFRGDTLWMLTEGRIIWVWDLGNDTAPPKSIPSPFIAPFTQLAFHSDSVFGVVESDQFRLCRLSIDSEHQMRLESVLKLARRNSDEVICMVVNSKWIVVLSTTNGMCEESCYLHVFDTETLAELPNSEQSSVTVNSILLMGSEGMPVIGAPDWKQIAWMGSLGKEGSLVENDLLVIASGRRGVGFWDLSSASLEEPFEEEIRYVDVPGYVHQVIPCPQWGVVLAVSFDAGVGDTYIVPVPS